LHKHWEVTWLLHLEIGRSLNFLLTWSRIANFHDVEFLGLFSSLLFTEAEDVVFVVSSICDRHVGETSCKTFKNLLLSLLGEEQLHVAADCLISSLINTN
jgi:hypothetical protein